MRPGRPQPTGHSPRVAPAAQPTRVRHVGECGMKRAAGGYQPRPVLHRAWLAFDAFPRCPSVRQPCAGDGPAWPGNPEARAFQPGEELGAPGRPLGIRGRFEHDVTDLLGRPLTAGQQPGWTGSTERRAHRRRQTNMHAHPREATEPRAPTQPEAPRVAHGTRPARCGRSACCRGRARRRPTWRQGCSDAGMGCPQNSATGGFA
jgi:hypothetical protein